MHMALEIGVGKRLFGLLPVVLEVKGWYGHVGHGSVGERKRCGEDRVVFVRKEKGGESTAQKLCLC
jgi:hypothetical protein